MIAIRWNITLPTTPFFLLATSGPIVAQSANAPKPGVKGVQVQFGSLKPSVTSGPANPAIQFSGRLKGLAARARQRAAPEVPRNARSIQQTNLSLCVLSQYFQWGRPSFYSAVRARLCHRPPFHLARTKRFTRSRQKERVRALVELFTFPVSSAIPWRLAQNSSDITSDFELCLRLKQLHQLGKRESHLRRSSRVIEWYAQVERKHHFIQCC